MGLIAVNHSSFSVFTSDNPRDENPEKIIEDMISGIDTIQLKKVFIELDLKLLILKVRKKNQRDSNKACFIHGR